MTPRIGLVASLSSTLVIAASLGAQLVFTTLPVPSPSANLLIIHIILLAFGVLVVCSNIQSLVAQALQREQQTECAWSAAADRIRAGGAQ